jgi:hypothetical protein
VAADRDERRLAAPLLRGRGEDDRVGLRAPDEVDAVEGRHLPPDGLVLLA